MKLDKKNLIKENFNLENLSYKEFEMYLVYDLVKRHVVAWCEVFCAEMKWEDLAGR